MKNEPLPEDEAVKQEAPVDTLQSTMEEVASMTEGVAKEPTGTDPKLLRPRLNESESEMQEKWEVMKLWFDANFALDNRADVVVEIEKIINYPEDKLARFNLGQLIYTETKLVQYLYPLRGLVADLTARYNFSYMYRKYQTANVWTKHKDSIIEDGVRITNGEVDQLAEISIWKDRCIEVFMQRRADEYNGIIDVARSYLTALRDRIRHQEIEDQQIQSDRRIYGQQNRRTETPRGDEAPRGDDSQGEG